MSITLRLKTDQSLYFLAPELARSNQLLAEVSEDGPADQVCISGILTVRILDRPRTIRQLSITFSSDFAVVYPPTERHRSQTLYTKTLNLANQSHQVYPVGEHYFAFSFFLPHTTAPSDEALSVSLRHRLRAKAVVAGRFNDKTHESSLPVRLIANDNAAVSEMPEPLLCTVESFSEFLGPYRCDLYADSLTVGSLLRIKLSVAGYIPVALLSIRGNIEERVELGSNSKYKPNLKLGKQRYRFCTLDRGKRHLVEHPHPGNLPVIDNRTSIAPSVVDANIDDTVLMPVEEGQGASLMFLARLPNCRAMRASTVQGSDTPIKVSHALCIDIRYRALDGSSRVMSIYKKVQIASCTCITESISLPPYEEHAHSKPRGNNSLCACGLPLDELVSASHAYSDASSDDGLSSSPSSSPAVTPFTEDEPITFPSTFKSGSCTLAPQVVQDVLG